MRKLSTGRNLMIALAEYLEPLMRSRLPKQAHVGVEEFGLIFDRMYVFPATSWKAEDLFVRKKCECVSNHTSNVLYLCILLSLWLHYLFVLS